MTTRVVTLDAGNTLFTERTSRDEMYVETLGEFGCEASVAEMARLRELVHDGMPELWNGYVRYSDGWFRGFIERLLAALKSSADPDVVRTTLAERFSRPDSFVLFAETLDCLEDLNSRGLRLALISNWSDRLRGLLDGLGLTRYFELIVISAEVGHTKPDPAIFRHVTQRLEVDPGDVLHVGDHPVNDLAGARAAGMAALLLDRDRRSADGPAVIRNLEQVSDRLAP